MNLTGTGTGAGFFIGIQNNPANTGLVNHTGGTINVTGGNTEVGDAGTGTLNVDGGTLNQLTNNFVIAQATTTTGTLNLDSGLIDIENDLNMNAGIGTLVQNGGVLDIGDDFNMATNAAANHNVTINGGMIDIGTRVGGSLVIGNNNNTGSSSNFTVNGGDMTVSAGVFIGNNGADSSGTFTQNGGTVEVSGGNTEVGQDGTGTFTLTGGTYDQLTNNLVLAQAGSASSGTVNVSGGTLNVGNFDGTNNSDINFNGGTGTGGGVINHTGGDINVERDVNIATSASANSTFNQNSGAGTLTINRHMTVGDSGNGTFNYEGGGFSIGGTIYVGGDSVGSGGSAGRANANGVLNIDPDASDPMAMSTDVFTTNQLEVGRHAVGVTNQSGATVDVDNGNLVLGQFADSNGTYNMTGGTLQVDNNLNMNLGTSLFLLSGDKADVTIDGALNMGNGANDSTFRVLDGNLVVQGDVVSRGGTGIDTFEVLGSDSTGIEVNGTFDFDGGNPVLLFGLDAGGVTPIEVNGAVNFGGLLEIDASAFTTTLPLLSGIPLLLNDGADAFSGFFTNASELVYFGGTGAGQSFAITGTWDPVTMTFGSGNDLAIIIIPEPSRLLLFATALGVMVLRRRRS